MELELDGVGEERGGGVGSERGDVDPHSLGAVCVPEDEALLVGLEVVGGVVGPGEGGLVTHDEALLLALDGLVEEVVEGAGAVLGGALVGMDLVAGAAHAGERGWVALVAPQLLAEGEGLGAGVVELAAGAETLEGGDERVGGHGRDQTRLLEHGLHVHEGLGRGHEVGGGRGGGVDWCEQ